VTGRIFGAIIVGYIASHLIISFSPPFDLPVLLVFTYVAYQLLFRERTSKRTSTSYGNTVTEDTSPTKPTDEYTEAMAIRDKLNQTRAQNNEPPL
jgi:hypothetical protein